MSDSRPLEGLGDVYRPDDQPDPDPIGEPDVAPPAPPTPTAGPVEIPGQNPSDVKRPPRRIGGWARLPILIGLVILINSFDWFLPSWIPYVFTAVIALGAVSIVLWRGKTNTAAPSQPPESHPQIVPTSRRSLPWAIVAFLAFDAVLTVVILIVVLLL